MRRKLEESVRVSVGGAMLGSVIDRVFAGGFMTLPQAVENWNCKSAPLSGKGKFRQL